MALPRDVEGPGVTGALSTPELVERLAWLRSELARFQLMEANAKRQADFATRRAGEVEATIRVLERRLGVEP